MPAAGAQLTLRSLAAGDHDAVRGLFRETVVLGEATSFAIPGIDRYERLCLDWYLGPGRHDAAVVESETGTIVGYTLVCTDPAANRRWTRRQAARFAAGLLPRLVLPSYRGDAGRFYRHRLRDGWTLRAAPRATDGLGHAHINIVGPYRTGATSRLLGAHIDERIRAAGLGGWYGEINAVGGTRARALERLGGEVVARTPNRTLTALLGKPVERLTVVRRLPAC